MREITTSPIRIRLIAEVYGENRSPFGDYSMPKVATVDLPGDMLRVESNCLMDFVRKLGVDAGYVIYFKKKQVYEADYGWEIEYEEERRILII